MTERIRGRKLQRLRRQLFAAQPLCVECNRNGRVRLATQRDHTIALTNHGEEDESNVQPLCSDCHTEKTRRDLGQRPKRKIGLDGYPCE